jgi:lysophospholipase L1-like esterase
VVVSLKHDDLSSPAVTTRYSVDAFYVPGVGFEYPQSALFETSEPPPPPPPPPRQAITYVAMGDSFSAGEGLYSDPESVYIPRGGVGNAYGPYDEGTDDPGTNSCHRHKRSYGRLLDDSANLGPVKHIACSGAVTHDFFRDNQNEPAQLEALKAVGATTKVVTLTIGGNDALFEKVLDQCIDGVRPADGWETLNKGWGCSRDKEWTDDIHKRISALGGVQQSRRLHPEIHPISEVLDEIHQKAPNATVHIAGYPQFFGTDFSSVSQWVDLDLVTPFSPVLKAASEFKKREACIVGELSGVEVKGLAAVYSVLREDALWINREKAYLNQVIRDAVKNDPYVIPARYVSPGLFTGHGLCDSDKSWLNKLIIVDPPGERGLMPDKASFHPTIEGQRLGYEEAFKRRVAQAG